MNKEWHRNPIIKIYTFRKPSPTCYQVLFQNQISLEKIVKILIERMSLLISQSKALLCRGSMTVEACLLLPLFLLFFLQLMGFMQFLYLHGQMTFALWNAGQSMSVYSSLSESAERDVLDRVTAYLYVKESVEGLLGEDFFDTAPIENGKTGIYYSEAAYAMENECIDLIANYQVSPKVSLLPLGYKRMCNHYYGRVWTGYDVITVEPDNQYVYVTKYGEVWHKTVTCKYLNVDIEEVSFLSMDSRLNAYGEKYSCCSVCREESLTEIVYITKSGERFHLSKECPVLKRHIEAIPWSEKEAYRACSACVKEKGE